MRIDPRVLISVACAAAFVTACGGSDRKDDNEIIKVGEDKAEDLEALCDRGLRTPLFQKA